MESCNTLTHNLQDRFPGTRANVSKWLHKYQCSNIKAHGLPTGPELPISYLNNHHECIFISLNTRRHIKQRWTFMKISTGNTSYLIWCWRNRWHSLTSVRYGLSSALSLLTLTFGAIRTIFLELSVNLRIASVREICLYMLHRTCRQCLYGFLHFKYPYLPGHIRCIYSSYSKTTQA